MTITTMLNIILHVIRETNHDDGENIEDNGICCIYLWLFVHINYL